MPNPPANTRPYAFASSCLYTLTNNSIASKHNRHIIDLREIFIPNLRARIKFTKHVFIIIA